MAWIWNIFVYPDTRQNRNGFEKLDYRENSVLMPPFQKADDDINMSSFHELEVSENQILTVRKKLTI